MQRTKPFRRMNFAIYFSYSVGKATQILCVKSICMN